MFSFDTSLHVVSFASAMFVLDEKYKDILSHFDTILFYNVKADSLASLD